MSWKRKVTIILMVTCVVLIILWDIFVAVDSTGMPERAQTTVSGITLGWAQHHPGLPFSLGGLCGHLLWPVKEATNRLIRVLILAALAAVWWVSDIWVDYSLTALLVFLPAIVAGHLLWPQIEDSTTAQP